MTGPKSQILDTTTICAESTPAGRGAVSVIRLSGKEAFDIAERMGAGQPPKTFPAVQFRKIEHVDDVLVLWFQAPQSFTGENVVEIQLHGNPIVVRTLLQECVAAGARPAERGEFSRRAVLNGKMELTQAVALNALIEARSDSARHVALKGLHSKFSEELEKLRAKLINLLSFLMAAIDFPEEGIEGEAGVRIREGFEAVRIELQDVVRKTCLREDLSRAFRVVFLGRPNAGKSSLFNAVLAEKRAIVSDEPGTTRDFISETRVVDGVSMTLVDTAGVREAAPLSVERAGIDESLAQSERADLVLYCIDGFIGIADEDRTLLEGIEAPVLCVYTKSDLHPVEKVDGVNVSIFQPSSIDSLLARCAELLRQEIPSSEKNFVLTRGQSALLREAAESFEQFFELLEKKTSEEILVEELQRAIDRLEMCIGYVEREEAIREVFSHFCVGK
jgi:tRNA modification GTPase